MPAAARCRQSPAHPRHTRPACASPAQRRYLGIRQRSKANHKFAVAFFLIRLAQLQHLVHGSLVRGVARLQHYVHRLRNQCLLGRRITIATYTTTLGT